MDSGVKERLLNTVFLWKRDCEWENKREEWHPRCWVRISLTLQNEGLGLHRRGVSLKFSSFVNASVELSKGVWEVFRIPLRLAERREIKERGEEGDWDVWGARRAAGNSLINFRNRFSRTASIHITLSPHFSFFGPLKRLWQRFGCLFAIQVVSVSHSPAVCRETPPSTSRARDTESRASSLGKASCVEEPLGWMSGWKEQSVKAWAQPDRLIHLSFSLLQLSLTPPTHTHTHLTGAHFLKTRHHSTSALFSYSTMPAFHSFPLLSPPVPS